MCDPCNLVARDEVLLTENIIQNIIPSFPALKVTLLELKLQWYKEEIDAPHVCDGVSYHCDKMDCNLPAMAEIRYSNDSAFLIEA